MAGNSIGIIRAFYRLGVRYVSEIYFPNAKFIRITGIGLTGILSTVYSDTRVQ